VLHAGEQPRHATDVPGDLRAHIGGRAIRRLRCGPAGVRPDARSSAATAPRASPRRRIQSTVSSSCVALDLSGPSAASARCQTRRPQAGRLSFAAAASGATRLASVVDRAGTS
jgi:hypothetical protein